MDDDRILEMGGTEEDIRRYAEHNGADLTKEDLDYEENCIPDDQEIAEMAESIPPERHYEITHAFFIAGVQHHQMNEVLDVLGIDVELMIVPEPTNQYDPNAVKLIYEHKDTDFETEIVTQTMLGYVPKKFSSEVVAKLAAGRKLECTIVGFYPAAKSWERCYVEIRQLKE
jgi:hypothetical protein